MTLSADMRAGALRVSRAAREHGLTVGVAESLTGGLVAASLAAAPQASRWFRGGVVAYAGEVKRGVLDTSGGPVVNSRTAAQMARGAVDALGADLVVAVTGVGGPEPDEGQPPGTVWFAVAGATRPAVTTREVFDGSPEEVVDAATCRALELLHATVGDTDGG